MMRWHILLSRYNISQESESTASHWKREKLCANLVCQSGQSTLWVWVFPQNPLRIMDNHSMSSNFIWIVKGCQQSLSDPFSWWMVPSFGWDAKSADFLGCQLPIKFSSAVTPVFCSLFSVFNLPVALWFGCLRFDSLSQVVQFNVVTI